MRPTQEPTAAVAALSRHSSAPVCFHNLEADWRQQEFPRRGLNRSWNFEVARSVHHVRRQNAGPAIRKYINLHQDYEARYWSEKFNVSRDELESVVTKSA
jgi:hypothetical protein